MSPVTRPIALAFLLAATLLAGCSDAGGGPEAQEADFEQLELQADETTGILRGVVVDEAIRPIPGVLVTAVGPGGGNVSMTTKDDGLFGFGKLAPGTYFVSVMKAGFTAQQASAEVVAGESEPKPLKILMAADPSTAPYVEALHLDGFMTCSVRPGFFALQCGFGQNNDVVNQRTDLAQRPEWIQSEMTWESTQAIGDEMSLAIRCNPGDSSDPAGMCPDGTVTIVRAEGPNPLVATVNRTVADLWAIGGPGGNPLDINLFAFGRSDLDAWDEETIDAAQKPATGNDCMQWGVVGNTVFGFDPETCMRITGPGLILNQKVDVYSHVFYGYLPPEGWTFLEAGAPPAPPA